MPKKSKCSISHEDVQIILSEIERTAWQTKMVYSGLNEDQKVAALELGHSLANLKRKLQPYA